MRLMPGNSHNHHAVDDQLQQVAILILNQPLERSGQRLLLGHHMINKLLAGFLSVPLSLAVGAQAKDEAWPAKPITFVAVTPAGGNSDTVVRSFSDELAHLVKVPVVIDNKPGAGGTVAGQAVLKAPADGHTVMAGVGASHVTYPLLSANIPYDVRRDFKPVALLALHHMLLVVRADSHLRSVADLIAEAKRRPDALTFGSPGPLGAARLAGELFQAHTGTRLTNVPNVRGSAVVDLLGGHIDMLFEGPVAFEHVRSGKLKALATTSLARLPDFPDVPTLNEVGLKGYEVSAWHGAFVSAATPDATVVALNKAIVSALQNDDVRARFRAQGLSTLAMDASQFRSMYRADYDKWAELISKRGLKAAISGQQR